jgi:RNA polymerase sigma factor (sigma-70 family)
MQQVFQVHNNISTNSLASLSDESLVSQARDGGNLAYVELCRRHSKKVYQVAYRITRNAEDAEDVLQDSWMRAFLHITAFDGRSAFSTWLTRIAINSALMLLRKRRWVAETSLDQQSTSGLSRPFDLVEPSRNPEEHLLLNERQFLVRKAVSRLPSRLRTVVEIQQSQDCSIEDIAAHACITVAATKSRLLRARSALKRPLARTQVSRRQDVSAKSTSPDRSGFPLGSAPVF